MLKKKKYIDAKRARGVKCIMPPKPLSNQVYRKKLLTLHFNQKAFLVLQNVHFPQSLNSYFFTIQAITFVHAAIFIYTLILLFVILAKD